MEIRGVGIGYQKFFHQEVLDHQPEIDFIELAPEIFDEDIHLVDELREKGIPISLHGLHLSFASESGCNEISLAKAEKLLSHTQAPWFSDHFSFTKEGDSDAELYVPPVLTEKNLDVFQKRIRSLESRLKVPVHFENVASLFRNPFNELTEGKFLQHLFSTTSSKLILNLDSILISAKALHQNPFELLRDYPLEKVESITLVPDVSMNPMLRNLYSEDVNQLVWSLLDVSLVESSAKSVLVQRRFPHNDFQEMRPSIDQTREIYTKRRPA